METLPLVKIDEQAFQACRQNNDAQLADEGTMPEQGGNLDKLKIIVGEGKMPMAEEFTMVQWDGTAHELIMFQILEEYEKTGKSSVLDAFTVKVGMSFKAHKKLQNIFQVIFIKSAANTIA